MNAPVLWSFVEESLEEGEFLWGRWERAQRSPSYDVGGVSRWIEQRLVGCIDGLRVGGAQAVERVLRPALESDEATRVSIAAHVLAAEGLETGLQALAHAWNEADEPRLAALQRGAETAACVRFLPALTQHLDKSDPVRLAALLKLLAFRAVTPPRALLEQAESAGAEARAAAVMATLAAGAVPEAFTFVERALGSGDRGCRLAAIEAGLVQGSWAAWSLLEQLVSRGEPGAGHLLALYAVLSRPSARVALDGLLESESRADAIVALGFEGTRRAADLALELLQAGVEPRLAGEAFCAITGLDLSGAELVVPEPRPEEHEPIPFEDENLDEPVKVDPEQELPLPDPGGVTRWWEARRDQFADDVRYQRGLPVTLETLRGSLLREPMRRRHTIALELRVRSGGRCWVNTRAFTREQAHQLQQTCALPASEFERSPLASWIAPL